MKELDFDNDIINTFEDFLPEWEEEWDDEKDEEDSDWSPEDLWETLSILPTSKGMDYFHTSQRYTVLY